MDHHPESISTRRVHIIARLAVLWAVVLFGRLIYLQVVQHDSYFQRAIAHSQGTIEILAPRGRILDRSGETLAMNVPADMIALNPRHTPDMTVARDILAPLLGLDADELGKRFEFALKQNRGFVSVKKKISLEESIKIKELNLDWMQLYEGTQRRYPKRTVGAHVIGVVGWTSDDEDERGVCGLEAALEPELAGQPGELRRHYDARQNTFQTEVLTPPKPGTSIGITIDERIQFVADRALKRAAEEYGAKTGSLVAILPKTGEILAMSSYPQFDPAARYDTEGEARAAIAARTNQAVTVPFEPGSVFKAITLSSALETTKLTPESLIDCGPGVLRLFNRRIHDLHGYGVLPMAKVLAKSSNIGSIQVALQMGEKPFLEYVRRFGFGQKTGIPLAAESSGKLRPLDQWGKTSIASIAMGHEISATTLQLALATGVIANGGRLMKPRLILWKEGPDGERIAVPMAEPKRVLRPETAIAMRRMMEGVVLEGTGSRARLEGYSSGGKTGSAQIFDFETRTWLRRYNSSFIGFAPVQDPEVAIAVSLNYANRYGGVVAAPAFREVAQATLRIRGVVPDVLPDRLAEVMAPEEFGDLAIAGLSDEPDNPRESEGMAEVAASPYVVGPVVPSFLGMTLRKVSETTLEAGIEFESVGNGLARTQYPPPGAVLPVGEKVRVEFSQ